MPSEPLCAYCRERPADERYRPFCCERCKMADLGRWLKGDYRVPVVASETDQDTEAELDDPER